MAKKSNKKRKFQKVIEAPLHSYCPFCSAKTTPDYKDVDTIIKYMSDRAKILGKDRSGVCSKHQRRLNLAIKRARHLALLPFIPSLS